MNEEQSYDEFIEVPGTQEKKIPTFLKITYIIIPISGLVAFFLYWNGSYGWLDHGSWQGLQKAAYTTHPFQSDHLHPEDIIIFPKETIQN